MPTYQYRAVNDRGKKQKGFIEAESQGQAFSLLQEKGLMPVSINTVSGKAAKETKTLGSLKDLIPFGAINLSESFYYLGMLLQSGTALAQSLEMLGRMSTGRTSRLWLDIHDSVEAGEPFSQTLMQHPRSFPVVYVGMIQVAESVGKLGEVLERIAKYEEDRAEVKGKLMTAMVYPLIILMVGAGAVYFLLANVMPKIMNVFLASKAELPPSTQVLLAVGNVLQAWGPTALLVGAVLLLGGIVACRRVKPLRMMTDRITWRIPLVRKQILSRFSGLLGFQLQAGIPLVQAMQSSSGAIGSLFFRNRMDQAREEVAQGRSLDKVLAKQGIFPEIYIITVSTGQRAGKLGPFLERITYIMEREVDNTLKRLVSLAEPLLILGVGLVIGFIVLAIMGPIFDLSTLVQ